LITSSTASATGSTTCVSTHAIDGTLKVTLDPKSDGTFSGHVDMTGTETEISVTTAPTCSAQSGTLSLGGGYTLTGTTGSFGFSFSSTGTGPTPNGGGSSTCTDGIGFTGALANGAVTGGVTKSRTCRGNNVFNGVSSTISSDGSATFAVTLR
jgi:hypothetical protein